MSITPLPTPGSPEDALALLLYGEARPVPDRSRTRTGHFSFVFEDGMVKHLRLGSTEIARRIYFAVRDAEWRTVPSKIEALQIETTEESFRAHWSGRCRSSDVDYLWQGEIEILSSGSIRFQARGKALKTFRTPRIGICLLLASECTVGKPFRVTYVDGQTEELRFDPLFKRTQLACRWQSLRFCPEPGVEAEYDIEGSYFDLEDQRNFGDVSFKAMAAMPHPDETAVAGREYQQVFRTQVTLQRPQAEVSESQLGEAVRLHARPESITGRIPPLGVSLRDLDSSARADVMPLIAELGGVLHIPLNVSSPMRNAQAERVEQIALETKRPVSVTVKNLQADILPDVISILRHWTRQGVVVQQLGILDNTHPGLTWLRACAREAGLAIPCGRVVTGFKDRTGLLEAADCGADFLAWLGTPLLHQADDETLLENAEVFHHQARVARSFAPGARLLVGPIRLEGYETDSSSGPDPRYRGLIGAAFVATSLRSLAQAETDLAIFFEGVGPEGHIASSTDVRQPGSDGNRHPQLFPSYYVLREARSFVGNETFAVESDDPVRVKAFGVTQTTSRTVVLVNQTCEAQEVSLQGMWARGAVVRVRSLDETTFPTLRTVRDSHPPAIPEVPKTVEADRLELVLRAYSITFLTETQ